MLEETKKQSKQISCQIILFLSIFQKKKVQPKYTKDTKGLCDL